VANEQNLKPVRTKKEAREKGRNGGIKSGEARRRKRNMREAAKLLLDMPISKNQQTMKAVLSSLGVPEEDADYRMGVMAAMLLQAANGNVNAATFLRDTAGDNPNVKMREEELKQRKAEFKFQQEQKKAEMEREQGKDSLADTIVSAYQKRMESEAEE
jgi:hypothetical protein